MKKKEFSKEFKENLKDLYINGHSKRYIAKKLKISTIVVDRILKNDLKIYKYKNGEKIYFEEKIEKENKKYIAVCKKTGKKFKDYKNKSGKITKYIEETFPEYKIPSKYIRREQYLKTNKYWYEVFFDIIEEIVEKKETKKCKYCDWETIDLDNKSGAYKNHLQKKHQFSIEEHLLNYPEDKSYFNTFKKKENEKFKNKIENEDFITCKICDKKMKKITNSHLKKHNITLYDYRKKYGIKNMYSKKTHELIIENYEKNL
jgi:hypothetical protein